VACGSGGAGDSAREPALTHADDLPLDARFSGFRFHGILRYRVASRAAERLEHAIDTPPELVRERHLHRWGNRFRELCLVELDAGDPALHVQLAPEIGHEDRVDVLRALCDGREHVRRRCVVGEFRRLPQGTPLGFGGLGPRCFV
jgi:hypothetical protein